MYTCNKANLGTSVPNLMNLWGTISKPLKNRHRDPRSYLHYSKSVVACVGTG